MTDPALEPPVSQPGASGSSPLLVPSSSANQASGYDAYPLEEDLLNLEPPVNDDRRSQRWLAFLILPGRIAFGALSYTAGAILLKRTTSSKLASFVGGIFSFFAGQVLVSYGARRAQEIFETEKEEAARVHLQRMAWSEAVQAIGKIVDKFQCDLPRPERFHHVYYDVSFARMLHEDQSRQLMLSGREAAPSSLDVLVLGRHYLDYAVACYGYIMLQTGGILEPSYLPRVHGFRGIDVAKYMLRLEDHEILVSHLDGEHINIPRHFLVLDKVYKSIVISIRGTSSISDLITDLLCENAPFAGGYAHSGMKDAAEALYTSLLPRLRAALLKYPRYSLVVTGHSLGGGVAILLTKILLMNGFRGVRCYAMAPCPIFGPKHKIDPDWSDAVECFIHADDVVPTLCFDSAQNLFRQLHFLHHLPLSIQEKKEIIANRDVKKLHESCSTQRQVMPRDNRDSKPLYLPSHHGVHWLLPKTDAGMSERKKRRETSRTGKEPAPAYIATEAYASHVVHPRLLEQMLVTPECINSHLTESYVTAFAGLDLPAPRERPEAPVRTDYARSWYSNELG
ncbi:Lipase (class 3) [Gracilaria domingensis]|nr:Lipase (class 3) [Gracilaria domingensis]